MTQDNQSMSEGSYTIIYYNTSVIDYGFLCIEPNVLALVKVKGSTPPTIEEEVIISVQQAIEETTPIQKVLVIKFNIPPIDCHIQQEWLYFGC